MQANDIQVITFDCYGTLIDWEKGAMEFMTTLLDRAPSKVTARQLFDRWEEIQFQYIQDPYEPYREILFHSLLDTLEALGVPAQDGDGDNFGDAVAQWRPFDGVPAALARLKRRFKLGIISNIDEDILAQTVQYLGVPMDYLITAERAGAYKPDTEPFRVALEVIKLPAAQVLHAAFGSKYDLGPAASMGMKTAFVNRAGSVLSDELKPTLTVASLTELATMLGC